MLRMCYTGVSSLLLLGAAVFAGGTVTLDLTSPSNGSTVSPGTLIEWTITAEVSTGDNYGLALISVDLVQDELNPESLDLPAAGGVPTEMLGFARPGGIANPGGYEGTQVGEEGAKDLAQIGGAQNTFGAAGPSGIGQDYNVEGGIGQGLGGQVIATGSFSAPATEGLYTFSIQNAVANTLDSVETPPDPSPVSPATAEFDNDSISFTVGAGCCTTCMGDMQPDCDGIVNVTDFTVFALAFPSTSADPNYDICADVYPAGGDGFVNITDFTAWAVNFPGPCP